ncbi:MAG: carboxymuconolactone decarboxylase family protein [Thermoanaerobaculia bacterium]
MKPKETAILSGDYSSLSRREALAVELAERMAMDPHSVTDDFWGSLKEEFSDDEIVELAFATSIFNWGNKFNITMRLDTDGNQYAKGMEYKDATTFWRRDDA